MLKRLNLQPLYFIIPNFQGFWYKSTPDTEFSFTDDTNGQLCGPVNFDIEQEYLFNDVSEFLTENIFNFGTDYIASTNRNFILDYWLNNVIMVGFTQGMIMVSVNDYLEFEAPFNNTFTPTGTKVYEFELFSNGKYEIKKDISPSYVLQPNDVVDIYVKAVYKNGEVIDGFIEHTLVGDGSQNTFNAVNIFLRGDIEDYDPNNTNYKIEIWKH